MGSECGGLSATMQKVLAAAPRVLVLHLKRFIPSTDGQHYDKRSHDVRVPPRLMLPLGKHDCDGNSSYELRSVVAHQGGSPYAGHYVTYSRVDGGGWRLYDDDLVWNMRADVLNDLGR